MTVETVLVSTDHHQVTRNADDSAQKALWEWEWEWARLTGFSWAVSQGKPKVVVLDVNLGDMPHRARVRIRGTVLDIPCSAVEVVRSVSGTNVVRIEVPFYDECVTVTR